VSVNVALGPKIGRVAIRLVLTALGGNKQIWERHQSLNLNYIRKSSSNLEIIGSRAVHKYLYLPLKHPPNTR